MMTSRTIQGAWSLQKDQRTGREVSCSFLPAWQRPNMLGMCFIFAIKVRLHHVQGGFTQAPILRQADAGECGE